MNIPVLIEPVANNGFRATGGAPFGISAEGATEMRPWNGCGRKSIGAIAGGATVVPLKITPPDDNPSVPGRGCFGIIPCLTNGRLQSPNIGGKWMRMQRGHEPVRAGH